MIPATDIADLRGMTVDRETGSRFDNVHEPQSTFYNWSFQKDNLLLRILKLQVCVRKIHMPFWFSEACLHENCIKIKGN